MYTIQARCNSFMCQLNDNSSEEKLGVKSLKFPYVFLVDTVTLKFNLEDNKHAIH